VAYVIADGSISFCDLGRIATGVKEALFEQPGAGPRTAEYFALRALRDTDTWPCSNLALRRELLADPMVKVSTVELNERSARLQPWRAYVARFLWRKAYSESQAKETST
jgi:AraC family transcriptional regulator of adaptative response / DNA-3-methyladenine glycosylase II